MAGVRVLVLSSNPLARSGLERLVQSMDGIVLAGSGPIQDAATLAERGDPDVLVFDGGEGDADDLAPVAGLTSGQPGLPIVVLALDTGEQALALGLGAAALLPAGLEADALRSAIVASSQGLVTVTRPDLAVWLAQEARAAVPAGTMIEALTRREHEVLQLLAQGMTNRRMAERLAVSEHTVKFHVAALLGKLGARTRAEAVARAIGQGLLPV